MGLLTCSIKEYIESLNDCPTMLDKLNLIGSDGNPDINKKFLFPEHLSPMQINSGIRSKTLFQGVFYLSRTNFQEGTVNSEAFDKPVLIQGLEQLNRCVNFIPYFQDFSQKIFLNLKIVD